MNERVLELARKWETHYREEDRRRQEEREKLEKMRQHLDVTTDIFFGFLIACVLMGFVVLPIVMLFLR